ncbi:MAG: DUF4105 domain-containing protein [Bacteroidota bacterium]
MRYLLIVLIISSFSQGFGQFKLSEQAEIAIVTLGPYQGEVWSAFGHSGFRIKDPANRIDWFYDYGLYDFDQENFFLNFARGLLKYKVGVRAWERSFRFQKSLNRYVKLQYLNLSLEEKQALFDYLQNNVKPENAEYLYNYVYDNCATKLRDVCEELYPGRITFDLSYAEEGKTVRDLMQDYLAYQPWGDLGIDLGLGMEIDQEADPRVYMFLPDYIHHAFAGATIESEGVTKPLVSKSELAYSPKPEKLINRLLTPLNTFIILFFVVGLITHRNLKFNKRSAWIDYVLFSLAGFVGWWVTFLWFGTEHLSKWNLNLLWAFPLHLPLIFFSTKEKLARFFRRYFQIFAFGYVLLLVAWAVLPQPLHPSLVPFVLVLALRCFYLTYALGKGPKKVVRKEPVNPAS